MNDSNQRIQRHRGRTLAIAAAMVAALAACGTGATPAASTAAGSQPATATVATVTPSAAAIVIVTPIPGAPDSGLTIDLTAKGVRWSVSNLTAPAGKVWHVTIHQLDSDYHNFIIRSGPTVAQRIFTSDRLLKGSVTTLDLPALPAGNYQFYCAIHPDTMTGTLTVKG